MHIPDGYLGPSTFIFFYIVMIPMWFVASRKVEKSLKTKQIPWLAFGVAFSFVIMMFNFPAPGGTTGHAVGAAILALTLGPWFGFLGVTGALLIQCLLFGDGGITTFATNSFNMGLVMSFVSYYVYKLLATRALLLSRRRWLAAAASAYIGLNVAALCCAIELGVQPILSHASNGSPLYAPFPLSVTIPAMLISHMAVFGFVDAAATGFLVSYIMRTNPSILTPSIAKSIPDLNAGKGLGWLSPTAQSTERSIFRKLWIFLAVLVVLVPLGLLAPGSAFAEWSGSDLERIFGMTPPTGLTSLESLYNAPFKDYSVPGATTFTQLSLAYILAAVIGVSVLGFGLFAVYRAKSRAIPSELE
ncbi:MAG TPA: cobalt transporter CbiM [Terriglobales bacterium]|nr:cobalt transporter CbiM [Terriglobales bacterium]